MAASPSGIGDLYRRDVINRINDAFCLFDPSYRDTKRTMGSELDGLTRRMLRLQEAGEPLYRSQQIASEATWLLRYTCDWARLQRRLHDLRRSLYGTGRGAIDQSTMVANPDGSFGPGNTEWFHKLDATADAVQRDDYVPTPLLFLRPVLAPGRLRAMLHRLAVSDIAATGVNLRGERAAVESALLQFLLKPKMRRLLADPALWDGVPGDEIVPRVALLADSFADAIDAAQHPRTGYWGPGYLLDGELVTLHDLSFTFHIVNFRKGAVGRWPQIIETTLAIGALGYDYPYGWKPSDSPSPYSNHHNTDVLTLFWHGRAHTSTEQAARVAGVVEAMLDWCLTRSLCPDHDRNSFGDFAEIDEYSTIERYAFGVNFLKLAGYWTPEVPFWWNPGLARKPDWPDPRPVAAGLLAAVERLHSDSAYVGDIRATLSPLLQGPTVTPGPAVA